MPNCQSTTNLSSTPNARSSNSEDAEDKMCKWIIRGRVCGTIFKFHTNQEKTTKALADHVKEEHTEKTANKQHICEWEQCDREREAFSAKYQLDLHMRMHTKYRAFKCPVSTVIKITFTT
jgi:hypothetical protein